MHRLASELSRLGFTAAADGSAPACVLSLAGAAAWDALSAAWKGVQADLGLPAPGIAVAGDAGYQLWFAFDPSVDAARARAFVEALRGRYLAQVPPARVRIAPAGEPPPRELAPGRWSAFVAPDLAALFAEETYIDLQPSEDAQADLLSRLRCIPAADLARALQELQPVQAAPAQASAAVARDPSEDPRAFLLSVMNDASVPLALRIEAAKALLRQP
ncbi:hypothetical protein H8N03_00345 [Ramlibacter sp. USB13]|uniref:Uncharacterized protein n=1 Tax=Ramlibacter cellulosilyticus TaxID=2764187 RepID=A0A923MNL3_9BURK|nr:hypothetical protein [Ramlibacter cellulosilyticus]MBC5781369.1 hypothetical protein [Ramlibacter cellulosilyticus]